MNRSIVFALLTAVPVTAWAQSPSANVFRPSRGFQPSGSYSLSDTESVSDTNGTATVQIPLAKTPPARNGSSFSLGLVYNSAVYDLRTQSPDRQHVLNYTDTMGSINMLAPSDLNSSGGWRYNYRYALETDTRPCLSGSVCTRMSVTMGDGGTHQLWLRVPLANENDTAGYSQYDITGRDALRTRNIGPTLTYYTTDGSFIRVEATTNPGGNYSGVWRAILPSGDYVSGPIVANGWPRDADQVCDRNDSCTRITNTIDPGTGLVGTTELVDAFERRIVITHSNPTLPTPGVDEIRVLPYAAPVAASPDPRAHASSPVTRVHWKHISFGQSAENATRGVMYECRTPDDQSYTCLSFASIRIVEKVELPTGLSYDFLYADDSAQLDERGQGELLEMLLPSKAGEVERAKVHYKWSRREKPIIGNSPTPWFDANINPLEEKKLTFVEESDDTPVVKTRTWSYQVFQDQSHVTAPDGGQTSHYFRGRGEVAAWDKALIHKTTTPAGTTWRCWQMNEPWIGLAVPGDPKNPIWRQSIGNSQVEPYRFPHPRSTMTRMAT